jgi:hypothetical protein
LRINFVWWHILLIGLVFAANLLTGTVSIIDRFMGGPGLQKFLFDFRVTRISGSAIFVNDNDNENENDCISLTKTKTITIDLKRTKTK